MREKELFCDMHVKNVFDNISSHSKIMECLNVIGTGLTTIIVHLSIYSLASLVTYSCIGIEIYSYWNVNSAHYHANTNTWEGKSLLN